MILTIIDFEKKHDGPLQGVFCWRHPKNLVGKECQWKIDDSLMIIDEDVKIHVSTIKEVCGILCIKLDHWNEAHAVKHFALSLFGKPIIYPLMNKILGNLHAYEISTFLVTNR